MAIGSWLWLFSLSPSLVPRHTDVTVGDDKLEMILDWRVKDGYWYTSKFNINIYASGGSIVLLFSLTREQNPWGQYGVQMHAVSANRILWVYAGFWWYHGILVVHLQDSGGAFWAIKDQDTSIRGLSVENVMTDGLSRVCIWWCIMLSLITKITDIYFVGEEC